jgi:hypothetical protein
MTDTTINYAYIRDPKCNLRVVTIAYTKNEASLKQDTQSVTYASAINRIDAFKRTPERIKNKKTSDTHRKEIGREIASYRLAHMEKATVGHRYVPHEKNVIHAIINDFLTQHRKARFFDVERAAYLNNVFSVLTRVKTRETISVSVPSINDNAACIKFA